MEHVNVTQTLFNILGTAIPLISAGTVAVTRLITKLAIMESEVRRLADAVEKQNGRIKKLEEVNYRHYP